ncbi:class I SAM-dependent methyltransferase [Microbacterium sp. NPDC057659]|uniref:class I SAM-dependent methyltransferase n=1 Tax=Microbacterium sp. NPDC057659 TaxID=3346198 RepID=UPI00366F6086
MAEEGGIGAASARRAAGSRSAPGDSSGTPQISDDLAAIREAFDLRAPVYDESEMHRELAEAVASFAATSDAGTVLDVATGTALVLRALRVHLPRARLIGADISPGMLAVARKALPDAEWLEADAASLPFPDASVDLITCATALHVIPDTRGTIGEWRRLLRPGGRVVTATFMAGSRRPGPAKYRTLSTDHESFESPAALESRVAGAGFAVARHAESRFGQDVILIAELVPEG